MSRSFSREFRKMTPFARRAALLEREIIPPASVDLQAQPLERYADSHLQAYSENVVGVMPLPLALSVDFIVNGAHRPVPMACEERSVVAAACKAAKLAGPKGFSVRWTGPLARAQVLLIPDPAEAEPVVEAINRERERIVAAVRVQGDPLKERGGGLLSLEARALDGMPGERWAAVVDLEADVRDIMGSNKVTLLARAVGVELEKRYGVKALAPIVGNDAPERAVKARAVWRREALGFDLWKKRNPDASGSGDFALSPAAAAALGEEGIAAFLRLQAWAEADPRRAVTHNKGIMNGVDAVATAVAQDTRAIEAGFWAEACRTGACRPMTRYRRLPEGHLVGVLKMPLAVGVHGGATRHPIAAANLEAMRVRSAEELAHVIGAVGLAQNFAALWCLAHEGIPAAHARLDKHRP